MNIDQQARLTSECAENAERRNRFKIAVEAKGLCSQDRTSLLSQTRMRSALAERNAEKIELSAFSEPAPDLIRGS